MERQSAQKFNRSQQQTNIIQTSQNHLKNTQNKTISFDQEEKHILSIPFQVNWENKKKKQMLNIPQAHFTCYKDLYSKDTNPNGYISLGAAVNTLNMKNIVKFFPSYLKPVNCEYNSPLMEYKFNQIISKQTPYNFKQTFALNNLAAVVHIHAQIWKNISIEGEYSLMNAIKSYSRCSIVPFEKSECHFLFYPTPHQIKKYLSPHSIKKTLIVVSNPKEILTTNQTNIFYAYEKQYSYGIVCGVCHYKNLQIQSLIYQFFSKLIFLSTFIIATIVHIEQGNLSNQDKQQLQLIEKQDEIQRTFQKMLKGPDQQFDPSNLYFGCGVTGGMIGTTCCVFEQGDRVELDYPYYSYYIEETSKSGIVLNKIDLYQQTLKQKAEKAFNQGSKGYIICNPHNPTGKVYEPKQIIEICEWAKSHPNFHLLVDQIYFNSIHSDDTKIVSTINYSDKYENIHTLRGLAKDFSLCGFKVGMLISCNKKIRTNYALWKDVIYPQAFMLKAASRMIKKSNFGQKTRSDIKKTLQLSNNLTFKLLNHFNINYVQPKGGCFAIIDFRSLLKETKMSENQLWIKIFYDYKINISKGSNFGYKEEGYFRICHVVKKEYIIEAIKRFKQMVMNLTSKKE